VREKKKKNSTPKFRALQVCPKPLCFAQSTLTGVLPVQPKPRCRRPKASLRPRRCSSALEFPLEVSNSPMPLISHVLPCRPRNCSPEQVRAAARPPHSRLPLSGVPTLVPRPRPCPPCHLEPSYVLPSVLWPPTCPRPRLRRTSIVGASGATTSGHGTLTALAVGSRWSIRDLTV
jgi:hypothetical protein